MIEWSSFQRQSLMVPAQSKNTVSLYKSDLTRYIKLKERDITVLRITRLINWKEKGKK